MTPRGAPRLSERELVTHGVGLLRERGFRTWVDPDGADYFDLVGRRDEEVGLVEAKVGDARTVLHQALVRRAWGNWVAVLLMPLRTAERLEARTRSTRASPVGVWSLVDGKLRVLREARPWIRPGQDDPYAEHRARFRGMLDALERGDVPPGIAWDSVPATVRSLSHGRKFREWRLDEE